MPPSKTVFTDGDLVGGVVTNQGGPVSTDPIDRAGIEGFPTGLSWLQQHRVARVVASASTDATDCAMLLAVLGIHPADGLSTTAPTATTTDPTPPTHTLAALPLR